MSLCFNSNYETKNSLSIGKSDESLEGGGRFKSEGSFHESQTKLIDWFQFEFRLQFRTVEE